MAVSMKGITTGPASVEIEHESGMKFSLAAPKDNGGDGSSFSPTDLCAVSLGACGSLIMNMFAAGRGIPVEAISFSLKKEMKSAPRRIERITVVYSIHGSVSDLDFRKIEAAGRACPVRLTLGNQVEICETYQRAE